MLWVDIAKALGIFLVVFGHVWRGISKAEIPLDPSLYLWVDGAIYLFHMPLFFALSGYFFEGTILRKGPHKALISRIEITIYPLILWSYITAVFLLAASQLTNREPISIVEAILYPFPPKDVYWFLWALFIIQTTFAFLVHWIRPWSYLIFFFGLFALIAFSDLQFIPDLFVNAVLFSPYFLLGMILPYAARGLGDGWGAIMGAIGFALSQIWHFASRPLPDLQLHLATLLATIGFIYVVAWLPKILPKSVSHALSRVGVASMAIYVSHVMALAAARIVLLRIGVDGMLIHIVAGTVAGLTLPLVFYALVARFGLLRWLGLGAGPRKAPAQVA